MTQDFYNYKELCTLFNSKYYKNGGSKKKQFEKWEKDNNIKINKVNNKNIYTIRPLTKNETQQLYKRFNYQQYLEPMLYKLLLQSEQKDNVIEYSMTNLMYSLYLINNDYRYARYVVNQKDISESLIGYYNNDLEAYTYETYKMLKRIINRILESMRSRDIIVTNDIFMKAKEVYENGNKKIITSKMSPTEIEELLKNRKNFTNEFNKDKYEDLTYTQKKIVNIKIANKMNISWYYTNIEIILNKDGANDIIQNNKYEFKDLGDIINNKIQIKINKSIQGDLKKILQENKELFTDALINRKQDYGLRLKHLKEPIENGE